MTRSRKNNLGAIGEFGLIDRSSSHLKFKTPKVIEGIGDDCAVYTSKGDKYQVVTTDALVEKVHFNFKYCPSRLLGRKALSVSISDIAAMGGIPQIALITLGLPKSTPVKRVDDLYKGLNEVSHEYKIQIVGGDTVQSPKNLFISLTLIGEVRKSRFFTRRGARPGDKIFVTGSLGNSALGLKILQSSSKKFGGSASIKEKLAQNHLDPTPRLREASILSQSSLKVTSMIDISDGLAQDLGHICETSKVGADLTGDQIPLSQEAIKFCEINKLSPIRYAIGGGEDFELLFTLRPNDVYNLLKEFKKADVPATLIGEITSTPGKLRLRKNSGIYEAIPKTSGFNHFKSK